MKSQTAVRSNLGAKIGVGMRQYAPLMILIGLVILFSIISPNFMTPYNILILVRQVSFVAISAVGLMFVMIGGAIDLSIGSQIILTNIVLSIMMAYGRIPPIVAIPIILVLGTALGVFNGLLSIKLKIHPLIITLGTASIYKGVGYIIANSRNIMGFPDVFRWFGQGYIGPIPVPIVSHGYCGLDRQFRPDQNVLRKIYLCLGWQRGSGASRRGQHQPDEGEYFFRSAVLLQRSLLFCCSRGFLRARFPPVQASSSIV